MYRDEAQDIAFKAVMTESPQHILARTQVRGQGDALYLTCETLASCVRHHKGFQGKEHRLLMGALDARIRAFAGGFVGRNFKWPQLAKDPAYYKDELACAAWEDFLSEESELAFVEVAFGTWFERVAVSFMRKEIRRGLTDTNNPANSNQETENEDLLVDNLESAGPTPEQWQEKVRWWQDAYQVANLTEQERFAITYHYYLDLPIESKDTEQETVSGLMTLTPQRIRQIMRSAEGKLKETLRGKK